LFHPQRVDLLSKGNIGSGRNVCIYFLLDSCKFGDAKCIYSHSKQYLDDEWWHKEEDAEMAKALIMIVGEEGVGERVTDKILPRLPWGGEVRTG
jgi:hypothetical protein